MEDNALVHIHHFHDQPQEQLGMQQLGWTANSPDLNLIEKIRYEIKDCIQEPLAIQLTAARIQIVVKDE